jgi:hypothetical protein
MSITLTRSLYLPKGYDQIARKLDAMGSCRKSKSHHVHTVNDLKYIFFRHHLLQDVDFPEYQCIISVILSKSVISASHVLVILVNIPLCVEFCNENMSKMLSRAIDPDALMNEWHILFRTALGHEINFFNMGLSPPSPYAIIPNGEYVIRSALTATVMDLAVDGAMEIIANEMTCDEKQTVS